MKFITPIIILLCLVSFVAQARLRNIINVTASSASSTTVIAVNTVYAVQCDLSGSPFDVDVSMEASLDGVILTEIQAPVNVSASSTKLFQFSNKAHGNAKLTIDYNSGTYNANCYIRD